MDYGWIYNSFHIGNFVCYVKLLGNLLRVPNQMEFPLIWNKINFSSKVNTFIKYTLAHISVFLVPGQC